MRKKLKDFQKSIDNESMGKLGVYFFLASVLIFSNFLFAETGVEAVYKEESIRQGRIQLNRAREFYNDRYYEQCIQILNAFGIVYPSHPDTYEAWNLLSEAYLKLGKYEMSVEVDLNAYLYHPVREEASRAYLRAGRSYAKMGNYEMAKRIFHELRDYKYFPGIAKEADLELRQWSVLSGNTRQIQENM